MIVHLAHIGQLPRVARDIPPVARRLGLAFWAGPLTLVLHKQPAVPDAVTAGRPTVAVRVPAHRVARALMEACGVPVAAPSANRFSRPSPTRAAHVLADLDGRGGSRARRRVCATIGVESTIVDCTRTPPVLVRPGGITYEELVPLVPDLRVESQARRGRSRRRRRPASCCGTTPRKRRSPCSSEQPRPFRRGWAPMPDRMWAGASASASWHRKKT